MEEKQENQIIDEPLPKRKKHFRGYPIIISFLLVVIVFVSLLVYGKSNENATVFGINISKFSKTVDNFIGNIFTPQLDKENEQAVAGKVRYQYLGNNYYVTDDQSVEVLYDGVISYVNEQDGYYSLIVSQKDGITSQYFLLEEVLVKVNDAVKQGDKIATYQEKFKAIFYDGDNIVKYEDLFS